MARSECEAGMKMMEELTTNAQQIQEQVLGEILRRNAGTEYLSGFLHGQIDKKLFKNNVPIVTYEDIKPYIDRIANGEPSDILLAEPVIQFYRSSGTSGGQPKLIPTTAELANKWPIFRTLLQSVMTKHFGELDQAGKGMSLMFTKPAIETPSGLKATSVSTSIFKESGFKTTLSKLYTSPVETIFCPDTKQSMYCQLLAGLIQRDEVVTVGSTFASTVLRAIKFLEDYWQELCSNIKTGQISDWIIDSGCRNAASLIMKHNPDLAYSIENICSCKSWEGIIRKLWPKAKYISAINTGVMSQYTAELEFYGGGLPLVSGFYACSEAICGINLEPLRKPSDVSYTFLPNMAYFEFLPMKKDCVTISQDQAQFDGLSHHESIEMKTNNEDTEPVDLVNVKPGQCYELLVTTSSGLYRYRVGDILMASGFHNNTPQFQFMERQNVILSIDADKTSEADLLKAVTEAKTLLDPLGFILTGYTSYGDISSTPGHYVLFWELKGNEGSDVKELDPKIMVECCSKIEESLNYIYKIYRKENAIAALEIRVVKQGTFDALMDYYVSEGASLSQYKAPSCTKSKEALKILDSRVIGKFFSPKTPI
ncbi:indole-3-acetic acid-amido synthetase GH3.17-like isoform X2 [Durio zibethinus]|uniref:Indole-3-acetic acid-amido synthetase GH3.17-like isoform X1 n=1 Tax=Durio zibethinus TaxID=66656 RepID=A0A6P5ZNR9_DURZI|nr:indole-3-acetic acid-amido synthetase GH3.17-like isoform X1 [Durio zibethinus]XP_022753987.1 indole-3-acetic acid-amido synthetase GH3.17-like isoform X2 [Durio zibethinus]